ncbi:MAG: DUF1640 domain-containing protein [Magnetococcales bacterium]|nr:DUF1640 domain-containing protein [Magnetococcales bacterium]
MTAIPFDTLRYVRTLKSAGFDEKQAEALSDAQKEVLDQLATKEDLNRGLKELKLEIIAEIAPLKWGIAVTVGSVLTLVIRSFFPH